MYSQGQSRAPGLKFYNTPTDEPLGVPCVGLIFSVFWGCKVRKFGDATCMQYSDRVGDLGLKTVDLAVGHSSGFADCKLFLGSRGS